MNGLRYPPKYVEIKSGKISANKSTCSTFLRKVGDQFLAALKSDISGHVECASSEYAVVTLGYVTGSTGV